MATCEVCGVEVPTLEVLSVDIAGQLHYACGDDHITALRAAANPKKLPPLEQVASGSEQSGVEKLVEEHTKKELLAMAKEAGHDATPLMNKNDLAELIWGGRS